MASLAKITILLKNQSKTPLLEKTASIAKSRPRRYATIFENSTCGKIEQSAGKRNISDFGQNLHPHVYSFLYCGVNGGVVANATEDDNIHTDTQEDTNHTVANATPEPEEEAPLFSKGANEIVFKLLFVNARPDPVGGRSGCLIKWTN